MCRSSVGLVVVDVCVCEGGVLVVACSKRTVNHNNSCRFDHIFRKVGEDLNWEKQCSTQ